MNANEREFRAEKTGMNSFRFAFVRVPSRLGKEGG